MEITKPINSAMTGITLNVLEDFDDIKSLFFISNVILLLQLIPAPQ